MPEGNKIPNVVLSSYRNLDYRNENKDGEGGREYIKGI